MGALKVAPGLTLHLPSHDQIQKRHSSGSMDDRPSLSARDYVESLHQNSRATLLYGKNNVLVQPVRVLPGPTFPRGSGSRLWRRDSLWLQVVHPSIHHSLIYYSFIYRHLHLSIHHMTVFPSTHPSIHISSQSTSNSLPVSTPNHPSIYASTHHSFIHLPIFISIHPIYIHPSIHPFVYLFSSPIFTCPPSHLSIHSFLLSLTHLANIYSEPARC